MIPPRTCEFFTRTYLPTTTNQTTFVQKFRAEKLLRYGRQWNLAQAMSIMRPRLPPRPCVICRQPYQPGRKNQVTCAGKECTTEMKRRQNCEHDRMPAINVVQVSRTCEICERSFLGHPNAIVCSAACRRERKRRQAVAG